MIVSVYVDTCVNYIDHERVVRAHPRVSISCSPKEGFDFDKIAALEEDLADMLRERLNDALAKEPSKVGTP